MRSTIGLPVVTAGLVATLGGCAAYAPQPLDLPGHARAWPSRDLGDPTVRAYAESLGGAASAPAYDPADGLSVAEAEALALVFNPPLRVQRAQAGVPLASAREAGWWPDPQFEAEILRFANRGRRAGAGFEGPRLDGVNTGVLGANGLSPSGLELTPPGYRRRSGDFIDDPWIVGASLSITIPISGRLAVERDAAWAGYAATWRQILIAEWELLTRLRADWLAWSATGQRIAVRHAYLEQLDAVAEIAQRLAAAGELPATDARLLAVEAQRQRAALQRLEGEREQQRLALFALLGVAPEAPVRLLPELVVVEVPAPGPGRRERLLERDPRIQAARAAYAAAEQELRLEVRRQYPDLTLGPSYSFEEGFSRLGLGLALPVPLWNRNRQAIAAADAARSAAGERARVVVEQAFAELARVEARLAFAVEQRRMLLDNVAPLVDRQVAETRRLLELGEIDVLVLRDALGSALEARLDVLSATLAEAQAANELEQMLAPRWITPREDER